MNSSISRASAARTAVGSAGAAQARTASVEVVPGSTSIEAAADPARVEDLEREQVETFESTGDRHAGLGAGGQRGDVAGLRCEQVRTSGQKRG